MRRALVIAAALVLLTVPATAQAPAPVPPAGSVVVLVMQSDGLALLPMGVATIDPLACSPGGAP